VNQLSYVEPFRPSVPFQLFWGRTEFRNYLRVVNNAVSALIADSFADGRILVLNRTDEGARYVRALQTFAREWATFYQSEIDRLYYTGLDDIMGHFVSRYNRLWSRYQQLGYTPSVERVDRPERTGPGQPQSDGAPWLLWGGVAVAALFGVGWLLSSAATIAPAVRASRASFAPVSRTVRE
jgi:hypothetical protein